MPRRDTAGVELQEAVRGAASESPTFGDAAMPLTDACNARPRPPAAPRRFSPRSARRARRSRARRDRSARTRTRKRRPPRSRTPPRATRSTPAIAGRAGATPGRLARSFVGGACQNLPEHRHRGDVSRAPSESLAPLRRHGEGGPEAYSLRADRNAHARPRHMIDGLHGDGDAARTMRCKRSCSSAQRMSDRRHREASCPHRRERTFATSSIPPGRVELPLPG